MNWPSRKAEVLVYSLRDKLADNKVEALGDKRKCDADPQIDTMPNRMVKIEMQTIGDTLGKVLVDRIANRGEVLDTLQHVDMNSRSASGHIF